MLAYYLLALIVPPLVTLAAYLAAKVWGWEAVEGAALSMLVLICGVALAALLIGTGMDFARWAAEWWAAATPASRILAIAAASTGCSLFVTYTFLEVAHEKERPASPSAADLAGQLRAEVAASRTQATPPPVD